MRKLFLITISLLTFTVTVLAQEEVQTDTLLVMDSTSLVTTATPDTIQKKKKSGPIRNFFRKGYP